MSDFSLENDDKSRDLSLRCLKSRDQSDFENTGVQTDPDCHVTNDPLPSSNFCAFFNVARMWHK